MSSSMKYLGAATDSGEWWCDLDSVAEDLGPGVSFSVRCGEDGGTGPHLICCYGIREDARLDRVRAEAERLVAQYQKPDRWHPEGRSLQGALKAPRLEQWESLDSIIQRVKTHIAKDRAYGRGMCREWWKIEHVRNDILWSSIGSMRTVDRLIERVGIHAFDAELLLDAELAAKWPFVAVDAKGVPRAFLESEDPGIRKGTWLENFLVRVSTKNDAIRVEEVA